nr:40S ribosomal protein S13-like [Ipomoea batatas]
MGRIHSCGKGISFSALPHKRTPLSWLSISSQDVVKILAAADSSISGINSGDEEGWVPLHSVQQVVGI